MGGGAVEPVLDRVSPARLVYRLVQQVQRLLRRRDRRSEPALVTGVEGNLSEPAEQDAGQYQVDLGRDLQRLEHARGTHRKNDELLEVQVVGRVPCPR